MPSFGLGRTNANQSAQQEAEIDSSSPWMAASEGNLALLQSSLSSLNLPISAADVTGYTLFQAAASYNQQEIMQYLLQNGANIHATDNDGDSVLHYAGNVTTAKFLVEVGKVDPKVTNNQGKTALQAKQEELDDLMQDEDVEDDDEDIDIVKGLVAYLSSLQ